MKKTKFFSIFILFNCFLNGCGFDYNIYANNRQSIKKEKAVIENLPNGNYRFCSEPNPYPYEDRVDAHRYCFTFTKIDKKVVGFYLYRAPKDTPSMCIEGTVEDNLVTGIGYESIGLSSEPYKEENFSVRKKLPSNKQLRYWDNTEYYQGGLNLKVGNSNYEIPSYDEGQTYQTDWALKHYENILLDLNNFQQIKLEDARQLEQCPT